jgi:hypothetical protein
LAAPEEQELSSQCFQIGIAITRVMIAHDAEPAADHLHLAFLSMKGELGATSRMMEMPAGFWFNARRTSRSPLLLEFSTPKDRLASDPQPRGSWLTRQNDPQSAPAGVAVSNLLFS